MVAMKRRARPPKDEKALEMIGASVRQMREDARMTADEVARQRGHTPQWLFEIERGASSLSFIEAIAISKIFGCPVEMLANPTSTYSVFRQPSSLADWQAMYRDQPARASAHFNLDRLFDDTEKVVARS